MVKLCGDCRSGPEGKSGHAHLRADFAIRPPGFPTPMFRCVACGTLWWRGYQGGGRWAWERATEFSEEC